MAAAAIAAECMFSVAARDIVIGKRCSRVTRNYSLLLTVEEEFGGTTGSQWIAASAALV